MGSSSTVTTSAWPSRRLVLLVVLALLAAACSGGERPTLGGPATSDGGVDTAIPNRRDDIPPADDDSGEDGSDAMGDGSDGSVSTSTTEVGSGDGTTTTYPPVAEPTTPPPPGVGAVLSPSGVLVLVTGQIAGGYVIETPCGGTTTIPWGQPIGPVRVVLDPGHGGDEQGAIGSTGLTEAELNLALSRRLAAELTARSIPVALTRNSDYRIPIRRRAALADALAPAAFVSIHHNSPASAPSTEPGTEVYVQTGSDRSSRLGGLLYESVVDALEQFDVEWSSRVDAGVLTVVNDDGLDAYGINRHPQAPTALIEMAYLGNPKEETLLASEEYLVVASRALADAIENFLLTEEPGSGFVATPRQFNPSASTGGSGGCVDPVL